MDPTAASTGTGTGTPIGTSTPAPAGKSSAVSSAQLRLSAGDKVKVIVFGEDKLSGEYQLDTGGFLSLPLAGTIEAAGLTKPELEQALTAKLKSEYLRNPKVTVDVVSFRPFYVLGEVKKPGEYPYRSGLNVLSAIAIGGGATYRANNSTVLIQRSGIDRNDGVSTVPDDPCATGRRRAGAGAVLLASVQTLRASTREFANGAIFRP